jgi:hypothetical protein
MFNALTNGLRGRSNPQDYLLNRFDGAAAAYSLRRLGSGSGNVIRAREGIGNTESNFTAQEVSGGQLREFALQNDADLIRFANQASASDERMYFDGVNDYVSAGGVGASDTGDFTATCRVMLSENKPFAMLLTNSGAGSSNQNYELRLDATGTKLQAAFSTGGSAYSATGATSLSVGVIYRVGIRRSGSEMEVWLDGIVDGSTTQAGARASYNSFRVGSRAVSDVPLHGIIYDVRYWGSAISTSEMLADATDSHTITPAAEFHGYGNTDAGWEDQVGSNDGTVNGSPALFSGQGFDAYVTTWYDQSQALGQPLSRFANRLQSDDERMYFEGVAGGSREYLQSSSGSDYSAKDWTLTITFMCERMASFGTMFSQQDGTGTGNSWLNVDSSGNLNCSIAGGVVKAGLAEGVVYTVTLSYDVSETEFSGTINGGAFENEALTTRVNTMVAATGNFRIGAAKTGSGTWEGLIYDVNLNSEHQWLGYGVDNADWEDQIGSNDMTVNNSPSLYDGRNAVQSTAANQPQIVADGVVVTDGNGNPSIDFDGTDDCFDISYSPGAISACHWFAVANKDVSADNTYLVDFRDADNDGIRMFCEATPRLFASVGATDPNTAHNTSLSITEVEFDGVNARAYVNGSGGTALAASAQNVAGNGGIGYAPYLGSSHFDGDITEVVLYFSGKSSDRSAIANNMADQYGITLS